MSSSRRFRFELFLIVTLVAFCAWTAFRQAAGEKPVTKSPVVVEPSASPARPSPRPFQAVHLPRAVDPSLFLDGVQPGMTYEGVKFRLHSPSSWTLDEGLVCFHYSAHREVWFEHGRVAAVFGDRVTRKEKTIAELGGSLSEVKRCLGEPSQAAQALSPRWWWPSSGVGISSGNHGEVRRVMLCAAGRSDKAVFDPWCDDLTQDVTLDGISLGMSREAVAARLDRKARPANPPAVVFSRGGFVVEVQGQRLRHEALLGYHNLSRPELVRGSKPPAALSCVGAWDLPAQGWYENKKVGIEVELDLGVIKTLRLSVRDPELMDAL